MDDRISSNSSDMNPEICPSCGGKMEYHNRECRAANGRVTPAPHYFCSSCDIEALPDGKWRSGSPNPYASLFMSKKKWKAYVKMCNIWHGSDEPA